MVVQGGKRRFIRGFAVISLVLSLLAAGCTSRSSDSTQASKSSAAPAAGSAASGTASEAAPSSADKAAPGSGSSTSTKPGPSPSPSPDSKPAPGPSKPDNMQQQAGVLTAGEWSDLAHWKDWIQLIGNSRWSANVARWGFDGWQRISVEAKSQGKRAVDAAITLTDGQGNMMWKAKTDNKGQASVFVKKVNGQSPQGLGITAEAGGEIGKYDHIDLENLLPVVVELKQPSEQPNVADMMFVMDTTGSMGDELEYIKTELKNVTARIEDANAQNGSKLKLRVSTNFYRDVGDEYVVRPFPFTDNIDEAVKQINKQHADGGGDYEEAVEQALDDAVNKHQWSEHARARLLFLVLDAPPHQKPAIVDKIQWLSSQASAAGIRIIPVASSGIDKNTEFLLRSMAIATGGTYVFLTDHSGVGNDHIEPTIGSYQVEHLNDLLVKIANRYLQGESQ